VGDEREKNRKNLRSGTTKDRCQLRIVMVYYHVHPRRRKCAMIRWTTNVRDVGTRCFHLSRRNVHVSLHAQKCLSLNLFATAVIEVGTPSC
jgi:hypothetical protein